VCVVKKVGSISEEDQFAIAYVCVHGRRVFLAAPAVRVARGVARTGVARFSGSDSVR
jgi:hypothetical protein